MGLSYVSAVRVCAGLALAILSSPHLALAEAPEPDETMRALGGKFVDFGYKASWSPDGKRIAYSDSRGERGIKIYDVASGEISTLIPAAAKDPAWQPGEGLQIAYARGAGNTEEVRMVGSDGKNDRRIADGGMPSWSKRGTVLFYHSRRLGQIMAAEVEGDEFAEPRPIMRVANTYYPALNPQTTRVAVIASGKLTLSNLPTGEERKTWTVPGAETGIPTWSHDGKQVSAGGFGGTDKAELTLLDPATGKSAKLAGNGYLMPAWSPDGKQIAVDCRAKSGVWSLWIFPAAKLDELDWGHEALRSADAAPAERR